jgi:hypothetical protein
VTICVADFSVRVTVRVIYTAHVRLTKDSVSLVAENEFFRSPSSDRSTQHVLRHYVSQALQKLLEFYVTHFSKSNRTLNPFSGLVDFLVSGPQGVVCIIRVCYVFFISSG